MKQKCIAIRTQKGPVLIACVKESPLAEARDCLSGIIPFHPYGWSPARWGLCFMNWAKGIIMIRVIKPEIRKDCRQPYEDIKYWTKIGHNIPPRPTPAVVIAMAIPLFSSNHRGIVDIIGMRQQATPPPIKRPQIKYTCHNELMYDNNKNPIPVNSPASVTKILGPYLSLNLPLKIPRNPPSSKDTEKAPDSAPLSQPNSTVIGLKNMPKVVIEIDCMAMTKVPIPTMNQP